MIVEPSDEIMVLRKLIFQTCMHSHPMGLNVQFLVWTLRLLPYLTCANSEGSGKTVQMRRRARAFPRWSNSNEHPQYMFLQKPVENYSLIIIKYPPYLFQWFKWHACHYYQWQNSIVLLCPFRCLNKFNSTLFIYTSPIQPLNALVYSRGRTQDRFGFPPRNRKGDNFYYILFSSMTLYAAKQLKTRVYLSPVKRICVFEHSVMINFNCACPAIQRGQGSGFLSEGSSWLTASMSEQRRFWRDCADAQARLNLRCSHKR